MITITQCPHCTVQQGQHEPDCPNPVMAEFKNLISDRTSIIDTLKARVEGLEEENAQLCEIALCAKALRDVMNEHPNNAEWWGQDFENLHASLKERYPTREKREGPSIF